MREYIQCLVYPKLSIKLDFYWIECSNYALTGNVQVYSFTPLLSFGSPLVPFIHSYVSALQVKFLAGEFCIVLHFILTLPLTQ